MDGLLIRHLEPADLDAVVDVYLSHARHHAAIAPDRYRVPERDAVRKRFSAVAEDVDPGNLHLVAVVDGAVVGHLDAWGEMVPGPGSVRVPIAAVEVGLAVLDAYRGRGIGTALIAAAEDWARHRGIEEVRMEVAVENDRAKRLYDRLGYAPSTILLARRTD